MNVVALIGRLTKDPELRYTNSQMPVCLATLAVDRPVSRNSQDGGNDRQADFIRITLTYSALYVIIITERRYK